MFGRESTSHEQQEGAWNTGTCQISRHSMPVLSAVYATCSVLANKDLNDLHHS